MAEMSDMNFLSLATAKENALCVIREACTKNRYIIGNLITDATVNSLEIEVRFSSKSHDSDELPVSQEIIKEFVMNIVGALLFTDWIISVGYYISNKVVISLNSI